MTKAGGNCVPDGKGGFNCSNVDAARYKAAAKCAATSNQPAQSSNCRSSDDCYTPARGPNCPKVRFGWGDCPGSRQACDWCYGPNGVFAYTPRGSVYTLSSGCNKFDRNTTWATESSQVSQLMTKAGGNCVPDGKGGYNCTNVDPAQYKKAANCSQASSFFKPLASSGWVTTRVPATN
jgi:hypothetical protein